MTDPVPNPAPIQSPMMGYGWQVVRAGAVIGHYRCKRLAEAHAKDGDVVRYIP